MIFRNSDCTELCITLNICYTTYANIEICYTSNTFINSIYSLLYKHDRGISRNLNTENILVGKIEQK